jgi:hypothetical protein
MGIVSDYEYSVAYHKGAFATLLNLKNTIERFKDGPHAKLIPKKVYKLLLSYIDVAIHNIDEFIDYGGIRYIIIDKDNNCCRVSEQEALAFLAENKRKYEEKKQAVH